MSPHGSYVDFPECSKRVGDDLIFYHPDRCVPFLLFRFLAIPALRLWTDFPVVVELAERRIDVVLLAGSQTGAGSVIANDLAPCSAMY